MSRPKPLPLLLSARARRDFRDILRYTGRTWGEPQLLVYRDKVDRALQALAADAQLGHAREDMPPTHLAYSVGSHIVVYQVRSDSVVVVRILHQRMSPNGHL